MAIVDVIVLGGWEGHLQDTLNSKTTFKPAHPVYPSLG